MAGKKLQGHHAAAWSLVKAQHGVVTRAQLLRLGFSSKAIEHRIDRGRLFPLWRGVYAVGRPGVSQLGRWNAAVLACGSKGLLAHRSAAALWGMVERGPETIEVVVPSNVARRRPGIRVHRRAVLRPEDRSFHHGIAVTSPAATLIDCASQIGGKSLEGMVNAADRLERVDPETLREEIKATPPRPGLPALRRLLDRHAFRSTESELERRFLRLIRSAGLPIPETQAQVNGFRVDFFWSGLGLVVETDGLRYHRTPTQQSRDLTREQVHAAAGLTALRFAAAQVRDEPSVVTARLTTVIERLQSADPEGFSPSGR
jgi:very-short-patch-repair endonuclease